MFLLLMNYKYVVYLIMVKISSDPKTFFCKFNLRASFFHLEKSSNWVPLELEKPIFNNYLNRCKIFNCMSIDDIKIQIHNLDSFFIDSQVIFASDVEGNPIEDSGFKI